MSSCSKLVVVAVLACLVVVGFPVPRSVVAAADWLVVALVDRSVVVVAVETAVVSVLP